MIKGLSWYILQRRKAVPVATLEEWARWMESDPTARQIGHDSFVNVEPWLSRDCEFARQRASAKFRPKGPYSEDGATAILISTIFLGLDHGFREGAPPVLFETLVFNGPRDGDCRRYCTYDEAEAGHAAVVEEVKQRLLEKAE